MFRIDISSLGTGTHHLVRTTTAESLDLDPERFRDIEVDVDLLCGQDRILVHMQVRTKATLSCDRTLRPFDQSLEGGYSVLFAGSAAAPSEESDDYEEIRSFSPADLALDLTDLVRDSLLLAVPQRKVAPGAEGKDLPTSFGQEEGEHAPVDPRWNKLRQLRDDE